MVCPLLSLLAPWVPALLLVLQFTGLAAFAGFAFDLDLGPADGAGCTPAAPSLSLPAALPMSLAAACLLPCC